MLLQETASWHDSCSDPAKNKLTFGTLNALCDRKKGRFVYCRYPEVIHEQKKEASILGARSSWLPFGQYPLGLIEHEVV